jgi:serine/threonine protein kinase
MHACKLRMGRAQGCHVPAQDIRDLIKRLLAHNPTLRLGSGKGGAADVKAHPWFTNFDWAAFAKRSLKAPYEPQA